MKKVLIVDDSLFVYEEMKALLQGTEFSVAGYAKCGEEAAERYAETNPDVVTMDIILPGIDGFETTREILKKWPDAKILTVSSLAYDDTMAESEQSGAKFFIYKPFDKDTLVSALNKCLA